MYLAVLIAYSSKIPLASGKRRVGLSEDQQDFCPKLPPFCTVLSLERRNELVPRSIGKEESFVPPMLFPMSQMF